MKKEKFEIYVPVHLRKLRYDIKRFYTPKEEQKESILKKFKNVFENK